MWTRARRWLCSIAHVSYRITISQGHFGLQRVHHHTLTTAICHQLSVASCQMPCRRHFLAHAPRPNQKLVMLRLWEGWSFIFNRTVGLLTFDMQDWPVGRLIREGKLGLRFNATSSQRAAIQCDAPAWMPGMQSARKVVYSTGIHVRLLRMMLQNTRNILISIQ